MPNTTSVSELPPFADKNLKKFLDKPAVIDSWKAVTAHVKNSNSSTSLGRDQIGSLKVATLFQTEGLQLLEADFARRAQEVKAAIQKLSTSTNSFRSKASVILEGERALSHAGVLHLFTSFADYTRAVEYGSAAESEETKQKAQEYVKANSRTSALLDSEIHQYLKYINLDQLQHDRFRKEVQNSGISVVPDLDPQMIKLIDNNFEKGIMGVIYPEALARGKKYSIFDTQLSGATAPVSKADLDAAINYFTQNSDRLMQKNTAAKLQSSFNTDQDLRNAVLAYHLQKWQETKQGALESHIVSKFEGFGVQDADIKKFQRQVVVTKVVEKKVPQPSQAVQRPESDLFRAIDSVVRQGKVEAGVNMLDELEAKGVNAENQYEKKVRDVTRDLAQRVNSESQLASEAMQRGDIVTAMQSVNSIQAYCTDNPHVNEIATQINELSTEPQVIRQVFGERLRQIGKPEMEKGALGFFNRGISSSATAFAMAAPIGFVAYIVFSDSKDPVADGFLALFWTAVVTAFLRRVHKSYLDAPWKWGILFFTFLIILSGSGFIFALILLLLWFSFEPIDRNKRRKELAEKWNSILDGSFNEIMRTGMVTPIAGIYFNNDRLLPPPNAHTKKKISKRNYVAYVNEAGMEVQSLLGKEFEEMKQLDMFKNQNWVTNF